MFCRQCFFKSSAAARFCSETVYQLINEPSCDEVFTGTTFNFKGTERYFPTQEVSQSNKRHQSCGIVGVAVFIGEHPQLQTDIHVTLNAQD